MATVADIFLVLCELAPLSLQYDWDNSGFLVGRSDREVRRVLLSLDVTSDVIDEAAEKGAELIVSHHPVIFEARRSITDLDQDGRMLLRLAEEKLAVISMHTNLDVAEGGVNDVLLTLLGAAAEGPLDEDGCGRTGWLSEACSMQRFLPLCRERLQTAGLRYHDAGHPVQHLAVMGGSGGDSVGRAYELGCDTYLTADIKYHQFLLAKELGINLIDGDHFCTEAPVMNMLADKLCARFPSIEFFVSSVHGQTAAFA